MVDKLIDILIEWAQKRWSLLFLFAIPIVFELVKKYYQLSFRRTIEHKLFWVGMGALFILSAVIDLVFFSQKLYGFWLFPSGYLFFFGAIICLMIILQYGNGYSKKMHELELKEKQVKLEEKQVNVEYKKVDVEYKKINVLMRREEARKYGIPEHKLQDTSNTAR